MSKLSKLSDRSAVLQAISEFNSLGRKKFLKKYGFEKAKRYFVNIGKNYYDSKAIVGAALKFQYPDEEPPTVKDFSGEIGHAVDALKRLHFIITDGAPKWLILAENEVNLNPKFNWQDVTGERYHFPNQYRNRIRPGTHFIYYRGRLRTDGNNAIPEYFGCGVIGEVFPDKDTLDLPTMKQHWFAEVIDYQPFAKAIPFRDQKSVYLELGTSKLPASNYWQTGVREIDLDNFGHIVQLGGVGASKSPSVFKPVAERKVTVTSEELMVQVKKTKSKSINTGTGRSTSRHLSGRAKEIGDLGEEDVYNWLRSKVDNVRAREKIIWVASQGETPGYDIEDRRDKAAILGYEVKATTGRKFMSIDITENELRAAQEMRDRYFLVLVANTGAKNPKIKFVQDPASMIEQGNLSSTPILYRLERKGPDEAKDF